MGSSPRYTWVNFSLDTIQIPDYALRHIRRKELSQIRLAKLDSDNTGNLECWIIDDVSNMGSLQELTIYMIADLRGWIERSSRLLSLLNVHFGKKDGWEYGRDLDEIELREERGNLRANTASYGHREALGIKRAYKKQLSVSRPSRSSAEYSC
jgi:hypothetical protein